jgi:hypothetical protein
MREVRPGQAQRAGLRKPSFRGFLATERRPGQWILRPSGSNGAVLTVYALATGHRLRRAPETRRTGSNDQAPGTVTRAYLTARNAAMPTMACQRARPHAHGDAVSLMLEFAFA